MSPGILVTRKLSVTFLPCSAINNSSLRSRLRHVPKSVASDTESERERNKSSRRNAARRWEIKEMAGDRDIGETGMQDHRGCWKEDEGESETDRDRYTGERDNGKSSRASGIEK